MSSRHDGKVWVRKLRTHYSSHPWEVRARNLRGYDYYETFYSWREAQNYADRLARTVEVVLPRITVDMEDGVADWPNIRDLYMRLDHHDEPRLGQPYIEIMDNYGGLDVEMHDLRPLALVLLALAEQEKQCPE